MKTKTLKENSDTYSSLHDDMTSPEMSKSIMERTLMTELFENALKDMFWAEKALTRAMPKLIKHSSSRHLIDVLETHLAETQEQAAMLEQVFAILGKKPAAKRCEAMEGLIKEGEEIIKGTAEGPQRDAGIIAASRKVEHYEIASYSTLCFFARTLNLDDAAAILEDILDQEKNADTTLAELAIITINVSSLLE
jgi:ferritin-like metal-binding protein YciE